MWAQKREKGNEVNEGKTMREGEEKGEIKREKNEYIEHEPEPLSLMPGPSGTLSKWAPITIIFLSEPKNILY